MLEEQNTQRIRTAGIQEPEEAEIDLLELLGALIGKWRWIAAATLACALIMTIITCFFIAPKYQSTATIYLISRKDSEINMTDLQIGSALTNDCIEVFNMWELYEKVVSNLGLEYTYDQMHSMLKVTNTSGTRMLNIAVTSTSPKEAMDLANEYAKVASEYIAEKMAIEKPSILSTALLPTSPVSPNKIKNILLGAAVGFLASCGVIVLITLMDDTYKTTEDIRKYTGLVTLAEIPLEKGEEKQPHHHKKRSLREGVRS